jgi:hypothetical protein
MRAEVSHSAVSSPSVCKEAIRHHLNHPGSYWSSAAKTATMCQAIQVLHNSSCGTVVSHIAALSCISAVQYELSLRTCKLRFSGRLEQGPALQRSLGLVQVLRSTGLHRPQRPVHWPHLQPSLGVSSLKQVLIWSARHNCCTQSHICAAATRMQFVISTGADLIGLLQCC